MPSCLTLIGLEDNEVVAAAAFHKAVMKTRWRLGRWGWWSYGGDECQILADLISDELNWNILYDVYAGLTGPYAVRSRIRDQIEGVLDTSGTFIDFLGVSIRFDSRLVWPVL
jgi:hypothetical protein